MFEKVFKKFGLEVLYTDFTNENNVKKISNFEPTLIWLESPTNPLLKVLDIKAICDEANKLEIPVVVDNTFYSAYSKTIGPWCNTIGCKHHKIY